MAKQLQIAAGLSLPAHEAATQKYAFLGRTGSGKTYGAMKLAELLLEHGTQVVVLDQVGVWHGLRLGEQPFSIPVLGGLHGDIPLEPTGGALVANLIVDRGISAVLDVSQMIPAEMQRFAEAFASQFFQHKKSVPSAVQLIIEECQEVVPQNPMKGEERTLHAFQRLIKLGRNFGIGVTLISQRPQEVSKKALNQTEVLFAFQMTGPQERKAIAGWVDEHGLDTDVQGLLPKLPIGSAHAWSPQWLGFSGVVTINRKRTADVSATPKGRAADKRARELSPIDIQAIGEAMAATIERQKAEDPRELRARIAKLEKDLRAAHADNDAHKLNVEALEQQLEAAAAAKVKAPTKVPAIKDSQIERLDKVLAAEIALVERLGEITQRFNVVVAGIREAALAAREAACPQPAPVHVPTVTVTRPGYLPSSRTTTTLTIKRSQPARSSGSGVDMPKGERVVLIAIAQHGDAGVTRAQLTVLTAYKKTSRDTYLQKLRQRGYIQVGDDAGRIWASEAGVDALGSDYEPLPTGDEARAHWLAPGNLPEGERRVLDAVCGAYPKSITREAIDELTGYKKTSRDTYLQKLSARSLVVSERGSARASETLFG